jgi:hypothetical protein
MADTFSSLQRALFRAMDEACSRLKDGTGTRAQFTEAWHAWAMTSGVSDCSQQACGICHPADELADLLADDASTFPEGHPCRDCGHLYWEHIDNDQDCKGWR